MPETTLISDCWKLAGSYSIPNFKSIFIIMLLYYIAIKEYCISECDDGFKNEGFVRLTTGKHFQEMQREIKFKILNLIFSILN